MPHGGYHGTVIMGGNVIQQGGTGPNAGKPPRKKPKTNQTAAQLQNQIEQQMSQIDDPREAYISAQANAGILSNLLEQEQQQNLANQVAASFAKGNVNKSDFTGDAGDKTFLGINLGSTPTAAATVINPITGEKIVTNKVREGMTSPEYAQYMSGLYNLNPNLMKKTFPLASGNVTQPALVKIYNAIKDKAKGITGLDEAKSVSPDIKTAYGNYIDQMNSQINNIIEGDKTPIDPGLINALPKNEEDSIFDTEIADAQNFDYMAEALSDEAIANQIKKIQNNSEETLAEDKEAQEEIERSLLNQYSLLGEDDLASSLIDKTQETDSDNIIDTKVGEDDDMDAMPYGYPGLESPRTGTYPDNPLAGMEGYPVVQTGLQYDAPLGQGGEFNFNEYAPSTFNNPNYDYGTVFSENISEMPKLGDEIKSADFSNVTYKDGGSVYNVLKLINDTMNDG